MYAFFKLTLLMPYLRPTYDLVCRLLLDVTRYYSPSYNILVKNKRHFSVTGSLLCGTPGIIKPPPPHFWSSRSRLKICILFLHKYRKSTDVRKYYIPYIIKINNMVMIKKYT